MTESASGSGRKQLHVYAILERKDTSKPAYWMRIGSALANHDGSLTLFFDAFPVGPCRMVVREPRTWDDSRNGAGRRETSREEVHP